MTAALAPPGRGLIFWAMRALVLSLLTVPILALASPAAAQLAGPDPDDPLYLEPELPPLPERDAPDLSDPDDEDADDLGEDGDDIDIVAEPDLPPQPDYSQLPPRAEREARLASLFERLATLESKDEVERATLVSEEIWAIWMDSGSASVNYLLVRADGYQRAGDLKNSRYFIDRMTLLEPGWAEAYARSARLALSEEDYARAVEDATEALIREPRHFYALWTLGNVLERIGKTEEALQVYEEAHALFPLLGGVKDRVEALRGSVLGDVL